MILFRINLENEVGSFSPSPFGDLGLLTLTFAGVIAIRESVHFVIIYIIGPIM